MMYDNLKDDNFLSTFMLIGAIVQEKANMHVLNNVYGAIGSHPLPS